MLKENVGKGNQYAQIGNNDADEIYNKFNTLNMDETEHQYTQDFVLNKREMNARMVYAYNEKNIPYNDTSMDIIFNKLINNLKTNQNDLDRNINTVDKEKISKIEFKTFKNLNEQYLIKDLNKIKDNEESKIKANNKPNHDNSISAINPIPYNKSKTENKSKNLFATISKVNTNDHCSFKSKNDININPELDDDSEENEDDIKINKGSTFDKCNLSLLKKFLAYTHKKRKISKELQLHQEYAKKKFISVENISRNKDKNCN